MKKAGTHIISNPGIMMGKPVIEGTRITVENILERLGAGETIPQILEAYPHLTAESVYTAINFAAQVIKGTSQKLKNEKNLPHRHIGHIEIHNKITMC